MKSNSLGKQHSVINTILLDESDEHRRLNKTKEGYNEDINIIYRQS